jgi:hypothetical protein
LYLVFLFVCPPLCVCNLMTQQMGVAVLVLDLGVLARVRHVDVLTVDVAAGNDVQLLTVGCLTGVATLLRYLFRRHRVKHDSSVVLELRRNLKVDGNKASSRKQDSLVHFLPDF